MELDQSAVAALAAEKKFIDGLGIHSRLRGGFHTHTDWLRLYLQAHDHSGLEDWQKQAVRHAKKRLAEKSKNQ